MHAVTVSKGTSATRNNTERVKQAGFSSSSAVSCSKQEKGVGVMFHNWKGMRDKVERFWMQMDRRWRLLLLLLTEWELLFGGPLIEKKRHLGASGEALNSTTYLWLARGRRKTEEYHTNGCLISQIRGCNVRAMETMQTLRLAFSWTGQETCLEFACLRWCSWGLDVIRSTFSEESCI